MLHSQSRMELQDTADGAAGYCWSLERPYYQPVCPQDRAGAAQSESDGAAGYCWSLERPYYQPVCPQDRAGAAQSESGGAAGYR